MNVKLEDSEKIKVLNSDDLYGIMQRVLLREEKIDQDREHFWVIGLANNHRILFIELISMGTVKKTLADPMEVFSLALQKRAVRIILCHNHPSGELRPSDADKDMTDRLIQVGIIVDTPVLDHIIISSKSYMSFKDIGLMDTLSESTRYVPGYVLKERLKKEAAEAAKAKEKIEIAKTMKREGEPDEKIATFTGLTLEEVQSLKVRRKK